MCDISGLARRITKGATRLTDQLAFDLGDVYEVDSETSSLARGWESWMRGRGLSETTIKHRLIYLNQIERERFPVISATAEDLAVLLAEHKGWTRRTYFHHLRSYFAYLVKFGHVDASPIEDMLQPPQPKPKPKPLTPVAVRVLLEGATGDLYAFLQLGRLAGFRIHETAKMHGADIGPEWIEIQGKGGTVAQVPTHPELWRIAQEYPRDGYWFPSPQYRRRSYLSTNAVGKVVREHFAACGIQGSYHRLRATFGQDLLDAGHNIKRIQRLMRHASIASTEHYIDALDNELTTAVHGLAA